VAGSSPVRHGLEVGLVMREARREADSGSAAGLTVLRGLAHTGTIGTSGALRYTPNQGRSTGMMLA